MATRLKTLKDLVQETINRGATSVEEVHKAIARLPFDTLAKIALFERPAESARALQERSIGTIYDAIRKLNVSVGEIADELLKKMQRSNSGGDSDTS